MLTDDIAITHFVTRGNTKIKTNEGPGGIAAIMKQYHPEATSDDDHTLFDHKPFRTLKVIRKQS